MRLKSFLSRLAEDYREHHSGLLIILAIALVIFGYWLWAEADITNTLVARDDGPYEVVSVVDGDTIRVRMNGSIETVRLIGIDAPEIKTPYTSEECYGPESSERANEIMNKQQVMLARDRSQDDRDMYNRLLRYVILDGDNVNVRMIEEGYAYEYTYGEPYQHQVEFAYAQQNARNAEAGLWAPATCDGSREPIVESISYYSNKQNDVEPEAGCILYSDAPEHVGAETCVTGRVDHVYTSSTDTAFINYCDDFRSCPFSAVIFQGARAKFTNTEEWPGEIITIEGTINSHEGRPQIILREPSQLH